MDTGVNPQQDPDVQLMLAVQRDSTEAFDALFRKYIGPVVAFASSYVGSRARAEELAQDAFVQLYRARHHYEPRARFKTFLYRIVTNVCLSEVRRAHNRQEVADAGPEGAVDTAKSDARTGEEDVVLREEVTQMRRAVLELPPQQRAALLLARVEGLSYEEVARSLACSVSAVKSLIHRATISLREQLRDGR
jgi:RNA polymerase sigma-70 factor, ECF subfamily